MRFIKPLNEKKPKGAPEFHHSDAPDAEGRFRDLGIKDLAAWLIKTRKKDVKKISGSLTQQIVFNRGDDPEYAEKMEKVRKEVYKQLGREDLLDKMDEAAGFKDFDLINSFFYDDFAKFAWRNRKSINRMDHDEKIQYLHDEYYKSHGKKHFDRMKGADETEVGLELHKLLVMDNIIKESVNEAKMPKKYIGNDEIVFLKTKEDSRGANYNLYYKGHDIDAGGRRFGSEKELKDFADNYILSNQLYRKLRYEDSIPLPESIDMHYLDNAKDSLEPKKVYQHLGVEYGQTRRGDKYVQINYIPVSRPQSQQPEWVKVFYDNDKDLKKISKELGMDLKESVLNEEDSYNDYPAAAKKNAQMAIDWKEKYGRDEVPAGTPVGWARAHQLAKGEKISADTVKRMSAFNRHRKNSKIAPEHKDEPWKDNGYVAWLIWGGDEGVDWAMEKSKEIDAMKESKQMKYIRPLNEAERKFKKGDKIEYKQLFGMGSKQDWVVLTGEVVKVKNKKKSPLGTLAPHQELTLKSGAVVSPYKNHKDIKLAESNQLNEAKRGAIHKAAKKGSYPVSIVVINSGMVVKQELVDTPAAVPAVFNELQKEYPNAVISVESSTGETLFSESVVNEGYWSGYDYDKWTKDNGKPKYPKWVKVTLKEIVKGGFMDPVYDSEHMYMVLWLGSFDNQRRSELSAYDKKGIKEFGKVGYKLVRDKWNDLTGYNMFFMMGAMYALEVSKQIQDKIANGESVEPAYYLMKEYFNSFGMDTKRSRIFNAAYEKLEKWMKDNNIKTL